MTTYKELLKLMEEAGISEDQKEACQAYLDVMGATDLADFAEAYAGKFDSDEEFAQDMAEQVGSIDHNAFWPHNCIDWEWAARELMYDYAEQNGHYFRTF